MAKQQQVREGRKQRHPTPAGAEKTSVGRATQTELPSVNSVTSRPPPRISPPAKIKDVGIGRSATEEKNLQSADTRHSFLGREEDSGTFLRDKGCKPDSEDHGEDTSSAGWHGRRGVAGGVRKEGRPQQLRIYIQSRARFSPGLIHFLRSLPREPTPPSPLGTGRESSESIGHMEKECPAGLRSGLGEKGGLAKLHAAGHPAGAVLIPS